MLAATESSIRALSEYGSEAIIDGLASTRGVLWQLDNYQKLEGYKKPFQETTLADVAGCLKYTGEPKSIDELNMREN